MEREICKDCQYYKAYWHGFGVNSIEMSFRCLWSLKTPEKTNEAECFKSSEEVQR